MYRDKNTQGNRLAQRQDDVYRRRDDEEKRKKARQDAMMKRLSPQASSYSSMFGGY